MNDNDERLYGCIPAKDQALMASARGEESDEAKIAALAAPWDRTEQPSIIQWNDAWKRHLEDLADNYDSLRDANVLPPFWEMSKQKGYKFEELCRNLQLGSDCTAYGETNAAQIAAIMEIYMGAEFDLEAFNPTGVYAYASGQTPLEYQSFPDNGRTIYKIAQTACEIGNFPVSAIGEYTGQARFTSLMLRNVSVAKENQLGFVYIGSKSAEELADIIILSLRACKPVIIGNMVALRDGTHQSADGVYISDVGGAWGGGHCTAAVDIKKVGNRYYPFILNSHGNRYPAPDGRPAFGTYITRDGLIRYLSGSFADVMLTTFMKRPRVEYYNLNVCGGISRK